MVDTRYKNATWNIIVNSDGTIPQDVANLAVLMDIRDELQRLNSLLHCQNFVGIPHSLAAIRRNTAKPREPKTKVKRP